MKGVDTMSGDILELRNKTKNSLNDHGSEREKGENIKVVVGYIDDDVARCYNSLCFILNMM